MKITVLSSDRVYLLSKKPETEMEKQVAELLESSENNLKDQKLLTQAEQKAIQLMNLDEVYQKFNRLLNSTVTQVPF